MDECVRVLAFCMIINNPDKLNKLKSMKNRKGMPKVPGKQNEWDSILINKFVCVCVLPSLNCRCKRKGERKEREKEREKGAATRRKE